MKRSIIKIEEELCDGCGACIPECPEGAIQVIDGKARLVSDLFCDGLGACLGHCPQGAITVEEREAEPYDERKVMENVVRGGEKVIAAHLRHLREHGQYEYAGQAVDYLRTKGIPLPREAATEGGPGSGGCPGMKAMDLRKPSSTGPPEDEGSRPDSELGQWPVQLGLLSPGAPYFKDADLVIAADCAPFAYADFHRRFLRGKILIVFCPKLDATIDQYIEKLTAIFRDGGIRSITLVHMEVPCCFGLGRVVEEALKRSGKNIVMRDYTISLRGEII
jgi:ferredoxin